MLSKPGRLCHDTVTAHATHWNVTCYAGMRVTYWNVTRTQWYTLGSDSGITAKCSAVDCITTWQQGYPNYNPTCHLGCVATDEVIQGLLHCQLAHWRQHTAGGSTGQPHSLFKGLQADALATCCKALASDKHSGDAAYFILVVSFVMSGQCGAMTKSSSHATMPQCNECQAACDMLCTRSRPHPKASHVSRMMLVGWSATHGTCANGTCWMGKLARMFSVMDLQHQGPFLGCGLRHIHSGYHTPVRPFC
jgi:hypothetical protein